MAAATSDSASSVRLEFHGALADRFAPIGRRRGTRTLIDVRLPASLSVADALIQLVQSDDRFGHLFDVESRTLPEHIEVVLNDRVLDLQGGLNAVLKPGDTLAFLPAHAGGGWVSPRTS